MGEGVNTTFFRMMDTRVARWWSNDPVVQPHQSPYNMMGGSPILLADPRGNKADDWVKIKQKDGSFRYKWDEDVTDQASAERLYGSGAEWKTSRHAYTAANGRDLKSDGDWFYLILKLYILIRI